VTRTEQRTARIAGSGSYLPPTRVDNARLFERDSIRENFDVERARGSLRDGAGEDLSPVDVFDRWARQVTGIEARRVVGEDGMATEEMAVRASRRALESAGMEPEELDFLVAASITGRESVPNMACTVAAELGVPDLPGFTLNAACAGFVYGISSGYSHIRSGLAENVLVVSADALSHVTDYSDPTTAVLFGDGAGAAVLRPADEGAGDGVRGTPYHESDYSPEHLHMQGVGSESEGEGPTYLRMGGGPKVLRQAIYAMKRVADRAVESSGLGWDQIDYVVPHQANLRITRGLERVLPLEGDGKVVHVIQEYGNVSASSVGITLDEILRGEHGQLPDPTRLVLTAVGGGYTSAGLVLEHHPGS